jgi:uncharacterized damage-inducible protein DinB
VIARDELARLLEYNVWANHRLLRAAVLLRTEDFVRDVKAEHQSVRGTLTHALTAEWTWLDRWQGISEPRVLRADEFTDVLKLRDRWHALEQLRGDWFASKGDADLARPLRYTLPAGEAYEVPLWKLVQHMVNESTHYRGQISMLLRQLGAKVASIDLLTWDLHRDGPWGGSAALGPR